MKQGSYSIRRRVIGWTLLAMLVIFGGVGLVARHLAIRESDELLSARLATSARVVEALVARQVEHATISHPIVITLPSALEKTHDDNPHPYGHHYETKVAFQVWDKDGMLLARSESAPDTVLAPFKPGFGTHQAGNSTWHTFSLPSGDVWILTGEKDAVRREMVNGISLAIGIPHLIGGAVMLLVANLILLINMRPLRELASRISRRKPESLEPIKLEKTPHELAPIVQELNDLLSRVKDAFDREQRFLNAAAHEIRTPIAALQLHLENIQHAETQQEREKSLADALQGLRRTINLVEQLLALSRITAKTGKEKFQKVSLNSISCETIAAHEPLITRRGQSVALEAGEDDVVWGAPYTLQRLLQNLIENASQYGAPDGEIVVRVVSGRDAIAWSVENDGASIPDAEMQNIFLPYYRILGSNTPGTGLGLAIVKEIVQQHGATIHMRPKPDGQGNVATVLFPRSSV